MKEKDLIHGAQQLDQTTLAEIYDLFSPGLYRYAMRLTGNDHMAEECVADTFTRFLQALANKGGPKDHLQAYLYRIAHNWITDSYRSPSPTEDELPEEMENSDPEIHQIIQTRQQRKEIRLALSQLTPEQRQVIALKYLEDWDHREISEVLQKPVGAVKALQHRALQTLRKLLVHEKECGYE